MPASSPSYHSPPPPPKSLMSMSSSCNLNGECKLSLIISFSFSACWFKFVNAVKGKMSNQPSTLLKGEVEHSYTISEGVSTSMNYKTTFVERVLSGIFLGRGPSVVLAV